MMSQVAGGPALPYVWVIMRTSFLPLLALLALTACGQRFSPDAYATAAVQQVNRVEQGMIVGVRRVLVQADGATGAATGGAAGGIVGSQAPGGNMAGAIGAVGGALVGGLIGSATERVAGDTTAIEYIVRRTDGTLVSVTQRDATPLALGTRVLVIAGSQARIVPDYTREPEPPAPPPSPAPATPPPTETPAEAPTSLPVL
jgi:outer membrane lipoprotein SlyB